MATLSLEGRQANEDSCEPSAAASVAWDDISGSIGAES